MKNLLLLAIALLTISNAAKASIILYCEPTNGYPNDTLYYPEANTQILLKEEVALDCSSHRLDKVAIDKSTKTGLDVEFESKRFKVRIDGTGFGLRYTGLEGIMISCPTIIRKAMGVSRYTDKHGVEKNGVTILKGLKASASVMFGADVGVFANSHGAACALTGFNNASIGFGISGAKMQITKTRDY